MNANVAVSIRTLPNGSVFRVISPKVEGKKRIRNDGIYRKEADSHCTQLGVQKDVIFGHDTIVALIPHSRFAR